MLKNYHIHLWCLHTFSLRYINYVSLILTLTVLTLKVQNSMNLIRINGNVQQPVYMHVMNNIMNLTTQIGSEKRIKNLEWNSGNNMHLVARIGYRW